MAYLLLTCVNNAQNSVFVRNKNMNEVIAKRRWIFLHGKICKVSGLQFHRIFGIFITYVFWKRKEWIKLKILFF